MEQQAISLHELNGLVKRSIRACLPDTYWVQAELSDVRANYSGHCYLEFIQKDAGGNNLIAKARGTIWSNVYKMLKPYFEQETGQAFTSGIKVLEDWLFICLFLFLLYPKCVYWDAFPFTLV